MITNSKVRVAAVGLGWVTTHRHLPVMKRNPAFELVGVIDRQPKRAEQVAHEYDLHYFAETSQLSDVKWLKDVDAVSVGTSPMTHAAIIGQALSLGKHVITEKPFAMTVDEGIALVEQAKVNKLVLAIVHNFQFARSTQLLLKDISTGKLGAIHSVRALQLGNPSRRLPIWYNELPLGLFYDESPHLLYLLRRFAGSDIALERAHIVASSTGQSTPHLLDAVYRGTSPNGSPVVASMHAIIRQTQVNVPKNIDDTKIFVSEYR